MVTTKWNLSNHHIPLSECHYVRRVWWRCGTRWRGCMTRCSPSLTMLLMVSTWYASLKVVDCRFEKLIHWNHEILYELLSWLHVHAGGRCNFVTVSTLIEETKESWNIFKFSVLHLYFTVPSGVTSLSQEHSITQTYTLSSNLGGLVCRAMLEVYSEKIHTFISLSSPQAGQYGGKYHCVCVWIHK